MNKLDVRYIDVKPSNLMIDIFGNCEFIDQGSSVFMSKFEENDNHRYITTKNYSSKFYHLN